MSNWRTNGMGRITIDFEVANNDDFAGVRLKLSTDAKVRRKTIRGVVDSGASRLVLPESVVKQLGLPRGDKVKVRFADGRTGKRDTAENVYVEILGRHGTFTAVVEKNRKDARIGAIVLEDLDLLVDCNRGCLVPRDPDIVVNEIE